MTNYISIDSALRLIPKPLLEQSDLTDFQSWMLDAYFELPITGTTESKIAFFPIKNGKVELPKELKIINNATYMDKDPSQMEIGSFCACIDNPETEEDWYNNTEKICRYTINYKMFLDSPYFNNNFSMLKYKGNASNPYICSNCPNRYYDQCMYSYTVDKRKCMWIDGRIECGFVCLDYEVYLKDEKGTYMIADYPETIQYLAKYAVYKHWEERMSVKEEGAFQLFQKYQQEAEIALKRAKGEILLRNADLNTIWATVGNSYQKLIQIPEKIIYAR